MTRIPTDHEWNPYAVYDAILSARGQPVRLWVAGTVRSVRIHTKTIDDETVCSLSINLLRDEDRSALGRIYDSALSTPPRSQPARGAVDVFKADIHLEWANVTIPSIPAHIGIPDR